MSQVMSQDSPLQNCTNTLHQSPLTTSKETGNITSPMKQSRIYDFIDLTAPKMLDLKSPSKPKSSFVIIDEIVISDSDDESPPKRIKNSDTPNCTPQKPISNTNNPSSHCKTKVIHRSPGVKPQVSPISASKSSSNTQLPKLPMNSVRHSTPVTGEEHLHISNPALTSINANSFMGTPNLSDIPGAISDTPNVFEDGPMIPSDVITVELFASNSKSRSPIENPLKSQIRNENSNNSSLPEPDFLQQPLSPDLLRGPSSQLAEKLNEVAIRDKPEQTSDLLPETLHTPTTSLHSDSCTYLTPDNLTPPNDLSESTAGFLTPMPFQSNSNLLTLQKMEVNRARFFPNRLHRKSTTDPASFLIEGKELPGEWIDQMIDLPLDCQTSFTKINSLQFVSACITTPRIKITPALIAPLVNCLITTLDENVIAPTVSLICDVIKSHPAITANSITCYTEVFTWDIFTNSIEIILQNDQLIVPHDSLLKLYCEVIESEILYSQYCCDDSYIRALFWSTNSIKELSSNLRCLIGYISKLFLKGNWSMFTLFKMFEQVLEWSLRQKGVAWHVEATLEFHNHFSSLDSRSYSRLIECIKPSWFAGYLAQKRLIEIGVSPNKNLQIASTLSGVFSTYTNLMPSHSYANAPAPTDKIASLGHLIKASHSGDCQSIRRLIKDGCDPNACDSKKWSSLHRACYSGEFKSIEAIVQASSEAGIYLNIIQKNAMGATPLHIAAKCGKTDVCLCLLKLGGPSLLLQRDENQKMPYQVTGDVELRKVLNYKHFEEDQSFARQTSNQRVSIDLSIIREFEAMLCHAIYGIFTQSGFTTEDMLACQKAELFLNNLTLQINRSQFEHVELKRFADLLFSLFA